MILIIAGILNLVSDCSDNCSVMAAVFACGSGSLWNEICYVLSMFGSGLCVWLVGCFYSLVVFSCVVPVLCFVFVFVSSVVCLLACPCV